MREAVLRLAIVFEGGLIVLAVAVGWLLEAPPFARVSLSWSAVGSGLAATLLPLVGLWRLAHSRWRPFRRPREDAPAGHRYDKQYRRHHHLPPQRNKTGLVMKLKAGYRADGAKRGSVSGNGKHIAASRTIGGEKIRYAFKVSVGVKR